MSTPAPHSDHSEDARADDGPPTDAFDDEVSEDAARAGSADVGERPDEPAITHP